jgi:integrase
MARLRLYQRGNVWWVDGQLNGERVRESTRETERKQAEAYATRRETDARKVAEFGPEAVLTFGTATGLYLDAGKSERYLTPIFNKWEGKLVRNIKPGHVQDLARQLYPYAGPATRNRQVIAPVQAIINHCAKRGLCAPLMVERFFVPKHQPKVATRAWLDKFMGAASPHLAAFACFMAMTGARVSEAIRLDWEDVDLGAATALLRLTKNGDPRVASLPPALLARLSSLPDREGAVFRYASRQSFQTPWANAEKRAGIEHIKPHDAGRRLFASEMVQAGVDPVTVAKAGGWKSVRMVVEVYAQPADTREAVNRVFGTPVVQPVRNTTKKNDVSNG